MAGRIFQIIGAGRGGTSLLMGLFDAHPASTMVSESLAMKHLVADAPDAPADLQGRTAMRIVMYRAACEAAALAAPTALWGHKATSEQVCALDRPRVPGGAFDAQAAFVAATRDWPVLFVTRDGRACVASKMARAGQGLEAAVANWKASIHLLERFRVGGGPLHVIRFEDLVTRPRRTLKAACGFLGLDWDRAMLAGTGSDKMRPEYRRDGIDAGAAVAGQPDWAGLLMPEQAMAGYAETGGDSSGV